MSGSMDISTIVFALLAIFVVWKLYSVLGTRTGSERPPTNPFARSNRSNAQTRPPAADNEPRGQVINMPGAVQRAAPAEPLDENRWKGIAEPGSAVAAGLDDIRHADANFTADGFMRGARVAYEHIIMAFAKGERDELAPLLSPDVLEGFNAAITRREQRGDKVETTFVGIDQARIEDARLRGATAQIAIRFNTKLITLTRDKSGQVIDGDPQRVSDIVDLWTFDRDIASPNPNWRLVATETHV